MTNPFAKYANNPFGKYTRQEDEFEKRLKREGGLGGDFANFAAGYGSAVPNLFFGARQALSNVGIGDKEALRKEAAERKERDKPLTSTFAGAAGNILGNVAAAVPAAFIPGANTVLGGTLLGAGLGFFQPSESAEETVKSTALGGAGGGLGVLAGRAIPIAAKALIDPFRRKGQEAIVGRTIARFAGDKVDDVLRGGQPALTPGVRPTLAETTQIPGVSVLQRGAESADPAIAQSFALRRAENNAALMGAIRNMGGSADDLANAQKVRETLSKPLYESAKKAIVESDDALKSLLSKPSVKAAWDRAQRLAADRGETLIQGKDIPAHVVESKILGPSGQPFSKEVPEEVAKYSGKGLHYLKMALDDMIDSGPQSGIGKNEARALNEARVSLQGWMQKKIPEYDAARRVYSALSQQPNEMTAAGELAKKLQPALMDYAPGAPTKLTAGKYAQSLRELEDQLPKLTDFPGANIESTFFPGSVQKLEGVARDLARRVSSEEMARGVGSNTAQNLASQNLMRQIFGPMGLPKTWAESVMAQSFARPYQWVSKAAEPQVQGLLADALLDPALAQKLMRTYATQGGLFGPMYTRMLPGAGAAVGLLPAK